MTPLSMPDLAGSELSSRNTDSICKVSEVRQSVMQEAILEGKSFISRLTDAKSSGTEQLKPLTYLSAGESQWGRHYRAC